MRASGSYFVIGLWVYMRVGIRAMGVYNLLGVSMAVNYTKSGIYVRT